MGKLGNEVHLEHLKAMGNYVDPGGIVTCREPRVLWGGRTPSHARRGGYDMEVLTSMVTTRRGKNK